MGLTLKEVNHHSNLALEAWRDLWTGNCLKNKDKIVTKHADVQDICKDKIAILISYGPSFEDNVKSIKNSDVAKNRDRYLIGCVDKAFRPLTERGIQPDFCIVADGSVPSDKWLDGVKDEYVKNSKLISNVYGSPGWAQKWSDIAGNKNIFWYLNRDNIETEKLFGPMVDYYETIEAASNVGNSLVVFFTRIFGAKKILLFGYDYSFTDKYYGTCDNSKRWIYGTKVKIDLRGDLVKCTSNMEFSAKWLENYIIYALEKYGCKIINYTNNGLINGMEAREVEVKIY